MRSIVEAIKNQDGELARLSGAAQDVTEQVRATELLRESKARLKSAERMTHVGNWTWDIVYVQALAIGAGLAVPSGSARLVKQDVRSGAWDVLMYLSQMASTVDVAGRGKVVMDAILARQNLVEAPLSTAMGMPPAKPLTPGTSQDRQPVYSPDGEWILFASNRSGNSDLWKISTRTGELRRLTDDPGHDWDPAFTSDGKQIVWSSNRSGVHEIWIADADGVNPRQITHDGFGAENPGATPDGWIYYVSGNPSASGYGRFEWTARTPPAWRKEFAVIPIFRRKGFIWRSDVLRRGCTCSIRPMARRSVCCLNRTVPAEPGGRRTASA
jgi:hypothetical protein